MYIEQSVSGNGISRLRRYADGARQRFDSNLTRTAISEAGWEAQRSVILDETLHTRIEIDWLRRAYTDRECGTAGSSVRATYHVGSYPAARIAVDRQAEDLGQTKSLLGHGARRIRIREHRSPLPELGLCELISVEEGWFLSLPSLEAVQPELCDNRRPSHIGGPGELIRHTGIEHWGFPVDVETRVAEGSGEPRPWLHYRLIELCTTALGPEVFTVPEGFARVESLDGLAVRQRQGIPGEIRE